MSAPDQDRRHRLATFLRAQRQALTPEAAGLPPTPRRRTPGLRREELAALAGISTVWYSRIEQGREVSLSRAAATRLAEALRLAPVPRRHLLDLAGHADPTPAAADRPPAALAASLKLIAAPAYLLDPDWTAIAWNAPAQTLFTDWLAGPDRNLLAYVFLNPTARDFIADWEPRARRLLAEFRADTAPRLAEPALAHRIASLRAASPAFASWWQEHHVLGREGGERQFRRPDGSTIRLHQLTLIPAAAPGCKLVMLLDPTCHLESPPNP